MVLRSNPQTVQLGEFFEAAESGQLEYSFWMSGLVPKSTFPAKH